MSETASRQVSPALERAYQFLAWLIPTLDKFPRRQKFLLGDRIESTGQLFRPNAIALFFARLYRSLGHQGYSSHSGRRTFGTALGRRTDPRNVQVLLGHASLADTMRYIEPAEELMRNAVMSL